jgi:isopropylmalate/homocitrate/citramalate synthase
MSKYNLIHPKIVDICDTIGACSLNEFTFAIEKIYRYQEIA